MSQRIKKVVFPVGGLGTRFLPATKSMPKEMLPVVDKPIIQYAFEEARDAGIEQFIFITGRNKNAISNHFDHAYELQRHLDETEKKSLLSLAKDWIPDPGSIAFIRQQQPLGLGHAIYCARNFIGNEPFAVILADEMLMQGTEVLSRMMRVAERNDKNVIAVSNVSRAETKNYGIIDPGEEKDGVIDILNMVEKPKPENAPSTLSIIGRYILQPKIFDFLAKAKEGKGGEIQLTDAMQAMLVKHGCSAVRYEGSRYDCGSKLGFFEANIAYALERQEWKEDVEDILKKYVQ